MIMMNGELAGVNCVDFNLKITNKYNGNIFVFTQVDIYTICPVCNGSRRRNFNKGIIECKQVGYFEDTHIKEKRLIEMNWQIDSKV